MIDHENAGRLRGLDSLRRFVGRRLLRVRRSVLNLGTSADELGHGTTELTFDNGIVTVIPGANEDFMEVISGPIPAAFLGDGWTIVHDDALTDVPVGATLNAIEIHGDVYQDTALVLRMGAGRISCRLVETDLVYAS